MAWTPAARAPQVYFREQVKESWQATAMPPIGLGNSWQSSCPSQLMSSVIITRSRTPGSFRFFAKAASSVFMKLRTQSWRDCPCYRPFQHILENSHQRLEAPLSLCSAGHFCHVGVERGREAVSREQRGEQILSFKIYFFP